MRPDHLINPLPGLHDWVSECTATLSKPFQGRDQTRSHNEGGTRKLLFDSLRSRLHYNLAESTVGVSSHLCHWNDIGDNDTANSLDTSSFVPHFVKPAKSGCWKMSKAHLSVDITVVNVWHRLLRKRNTIGPYAADVKLDCNLRVVVPGPETLKASIVTRHLTDTFNYERKIDLLPAGQPQSFTLTSANPINFGEAFDVIVGCELFHEARTKRLRLESEVSIIIRIDKITIGPTA